ncbi:MAG: toprim domain-containing protein [Candidatus Nanoarchaeia archaeon]|nr:toprim domain-containing protein [Candidatus Nanoarchaeia archaeon]
MIDFIRLLKDYSIDYVQLVDGWINFNCPYHDNGTRGFKAGYNIYGNYVYCWKCGYHKIEKILSDILNISYNLTKTIVQEYSTEEVIRNKLNKKTNKINKIKLPGEEIKKNDKFYNYIKKRNFNPEYIIKTYNIKSGGLIGFYNFRIIIPIYFNNKLVSFQARSIYSSKKCDDLGILRYITNSIEKSIIDPKYILYNIDNCKKDFIVLVEGIFDCWRLGPNNIAATMGTSMTEEQINLLAYRYKKIIFLFDNEKDAQKRAKKYGELLVSLGKEVEIFNPEFKHDPGDYTKEEKKIVRKELGL